MRRRRAKRGRSLASGTVLIGWVENMMLLAVGTVLAAFAIPQINPPPRNVAELMNPTQPTPFYVEVRWWEDKKWWDEKIDPPPHDVDTYLVCYNQANGVKANPIAIFYNKRSDGYLTLDHDSTGYPNSELDVEEVRVNSSVRNIPANTQCWINVHLFNSHGGKLPINVQVLAISDKDSPEQKTIADVQLALDKPGEECGVMHIWWDEKSHYIPASLQTYPKLGTMQIATSGQPESAAPTCTQRENPL